MMKKEFESYCYDTFGDIELFSPVFYRFPISIRFEIGMDYDGKDNGTYVDNAVYRANCIFNELFGKDDNVYIVVNSYEDYPNDYSQWHEKKKKDISVVRPLVNGIIEECSYTFIPKEDPDWECKRYILKSKTRNISIGNLLDEIIRSDVKGKNNLASGVTLINIETNIIYHLYDDRGLDVASDNKDKLKNIYVKFNDWILHYNRKEIDDKFA